MTDKEFEDAFTAAGGWFLLPQAETVLDWTGSQGELIDHLYTKGFDAKRRGTQTRVSSMRRLINEGCFADALIKVRDSNRINRQHPKAYQIASDILQRRFKTVL